MRSYPVQVRGVSRADVVVASCFVLAAVAEAVARDRTAPGLLIFEVTGALWLGCLAVRRTRPIVSITVLAMGGVLGSTTTQLFWPDATDNGGVWILALMLAAYSLGAHGSGPVVALGVLLPAVVVFSADLTSRSGWDRVNGMVFVTVFIGLLPTAVGRVVHMCRDRFEMLRVQHEQIMCAQRARQESGVLAERLRVVERLRPSLVDGLHALAAAAETGSDPAQVEATARDLLARTREEVVALTAPLESSPVPDLTEVDHVRVLTAAAQPWTVLAAGAAVAGLYLETTKVLPSTTPSWLVLPAALLVGMPLAFVWWRPVTAALIAWAVTVAYSHVVAPLSGTLSETAIAVSLAFVVGALSSRRAAVAGLMVCWVGHLVVVDGHDAFGDAVMLLACWLGGLAVNEASRLVEQARANNRLLAQQEPAAAERAVVDERLRLAREIHDAIGHSLTVITLQAGAARRLVDRDPRRAQEVMRTVAAAAADGVAVLDHDGGAADIASLIDRLEGAGLEVAAELTDMRYLDEALWPVLFRVVQEGLTNVIRHAPGARVTVVVRRRDDAVEVTVANSAPTESGGGPGTGRGLEGIRERLAAVGAGHVTWGPMEDGGFALRASIPCTNGATVSR
jgi:signal transduction histidine kinase